MNSCTILDRSHAANLRHDFSHNGLDGGIFNGGTDGQAERVTDCLIQSPEEVHHGQRIPCSDHGLPTINVTGERTHIFL